MGADYRKPWIVSEQILSCQSTHANKLCTKCIEHNTGHRPSPHNGQKKRDSEESRKSTPKEEGGGDKTEHPSLLALQRLSVCFAFFPRSRPCASQICAPRNTIQDRSIYYKNVFFTTENKRLKYKSSNTFKIVKQNTRTTQQPISQKNGATHHFLPIRHQPSLRVKSSINYHGDSDGMHG